jgi:RNA polymerase sigma-32 factor
MLAKACRKELFCNNQIEMPCQEDCSDNLSKDSEPKEELRPSPISPLQRYMKEINQYPLLKPEEEFRLAKLYHQTGDAEAANTLVVSNLRLVVKIAFDFQKFWTKNLMDLIQEGNIGIMQAIKKYDPFRGIKLSYYASFWIKAYMLKYIMDNWKLVRIGTTQAQRNLFFNLKKEKEKLHSQGIEVGYKLLAERLQVKENEVLEMDQRLDSWEYSLDSPLITDGDGKSSDFLIAPETSPEEELSQHQMKEIFHNSLQTFHHTLKKKEQDILSQRLLAEKPVSLQQLGDKHKISRERIRQIEERMIKKLRQFLHNEIPDFINFQSLLSPG